MKEKCFLQLIAALLAAKAIFGVLYLLFAWEIAIAGWVMPMWLVVVAVLVDSYLAFLAYKFSKGKK